MHVRRLAGVLTQRFLCLVLSFACAAACDLPPGTSTPVVTETFSGSIVASGQSVYTFTVLTKSTITVHLSRVDPLATLLGLAVGTPKGGVDCAILSSNPDTGAAATPQISVTTSGGTYCVEVFDTGGVSGSASFSVVIVHS